MTGTKNVVNSSAGKGVVVTGTETDVNKVLVLSAIGLDVVGTLMVVSRFSP